MLSPLRHEGQREVEGIKGGLVDAWLRRRCAERYDYYSSEQDRLLGSTFLWYGMDEWEEIGKSVVHFSKFFWCDLSSRHFSLPFVSFSTCSPPIHPAVSFPFSLPLSASSTVPSLPGSSSTQPSPASPVPRAAPAHLSSAVATVDQDVRSGGVAASVAAKIDIRTLELLGVTVASHRDHAHPQILRLLRYKVAQAGVDVARRDGVDAGESAPFVGQALRHVDAPGLGHVVARLLLREVGNVPGHRGRDHQAAGSLLLEVRADRLRAVEGSVQVGLHDIVPLLHRRVQDAGVGRLARVGNEGVNLPKVRQHIVD